MLRQKNNLMTKSSRKSKQVLVPQDTVSFRHRLGARLMSGMDVENPTLKNHLGMWLHQVKLSEGPTGKYYGSRTGGGNNVKSSPVTYEQIVRLGYANIVWVYRCANAVAQAVSSVGWEERKANKDAGSLPVDEGRKERILKNPNPYMSLKNLIYNHALHVMLSGNGYMELTQVNREPRFLFPMRPDWVTPLPDSGKKYLEGYEFRTPDMPAPIVLKPMGVIHTKLTDPLNEFRGLPPMASCWSTVRNENQAISWTQALLRNSAIPSGVLSTTANLDKETVDELRESIEIQFTGDNRFKPMVLWGGLDWKQLTLSPREMDFFRMRQSSKFEVCAAMGVPPALVGALEDPTYANYETARTAFWEDTVLFLLDLIKCQINLVFDYHMGDTTFVTYDISNVPALLPAYERKVKAAKSLYTMGVPINDLNRRFNLGFRKFAWGDVAWMQQQQVPVSSAKPIHTELLSAQIDKLKEPTPEPVVGSPQDTPKETVPTKQ